MKILISEKQRKLLAENQLHYTDEKLQEFFQKGLQYLAKIIQVKNQYANQVVLTSINDIIENEEKYTELLKNIKEYIERVDNIYEKLYNVTEMYDFMDRPQIVSRLEYDVVNKIEDVKYRLENIFDVLESAIDLANDMKKVLNP